MVEHCKNCIFAKNCLHYETGACIHKDQDCDSCAAECFLCKYEDTCVASCKGKECTECDFYQKICKGGEQYDS